MYHVIYPSNVNECSQTSDQIIAAPRTHIATSALLLLFIVRLLLNETIAAESEAQGKVNNLQELSPGLLFSGSARRSSNL